MIRGDNRIPMYLDRNWGNRTSWGKNMLNDITIVECEVMSHLVRLRGKDTVQTTHCAVEKSQTNATNATRQFEETFENTQWRKVKQKQTMPLCLISGKPFEEIFENAHWGKVKQMQPMQICFISCRQFEDTFENPQKRKDK